MLCRDCALAHPARLQLPRRRPARRLRPATAAVTRSDPRGSQPEHPFLHRRRRGEGGTRGQLHVCPGETLGIVGESGCGKSVTAMSVLGLVQRPGKVVGGEIMFKGHDLLKLTNEELRNIRGRDIAMIFQDPLSSLNPVLRVGYQIDEAMCAHDKIPQAMISSARDRSAQAGAGLGCGAPHQGLPPPVQWWDAPARHDRHGPLEQARSAHRR